jgi:hypothetical protein
MSGSGGRAMNEVHERMRVLAHDDNVRQFISARILMHKTRLKKEATGLSQLSPIDPNLATHYAVMQTLINYLELDIRLLENLLIHSVSINQQG